MHSDAAAYRATPAGSSGFGRKALATLTAGLLALAFGACGEAPTTPESSFAIGQGPPGSTIQVTAVQEGGDLRFVLSDDVLPSGWVTFDFVNETGITHFIFMSSLADGALTGLEEDFDEVSREAYMDAVSLPFQVAWDPFFDRDIDVNEFLGDLVAALPAWLFTDTRPSGGPGLLAGGESSKTTLYLEPGTYAIECYVLGGGGTFHSTRGMVELIEVTDGESSPQPEPRPTISLSISSVDGIVMDAGKLRPGMHTVGVTFVDNTLYGHGQGHDVHFIRLDAGTTPADVNEWMNYLPLDADLFYDAGKRGLTSTGADPGPLTFLGGVQDIQQLPGETAYFHVLLNPGHYAFVAEVPDPAGNDMLVEFTVP